MTENDFTRFDNAFRAMCEVWEKEPSPALIALYFRTLQSYQVDVVEKAITTAITTQKFFPKPAELLDAINGSAQQIEDRANIEALNVVKAIRHIGGYQSVVFDDPVTAAVILEGFGGWLRLCDELRDGKETWFVKDFVAMYRAFTRSGRRHVDGKLCGRIEADNLSRGGEIAKCLPEPVAVAGVRNQKLIGGVA